VERFHRPTIEQVTAYCAEREKLGKPKVDPQVFIDFYESKGWVVGKSPMRDWKAAVRTWEKRERMDAPRMQDRTNTVGPQRQTKCFCGKPARFWTGLIGKCADCVDG